MKENYLEHAIPFLSRIPKERRELFETYFKTAPIWLLESFIIIDKMKRGTIFVQEGTPVDYIYLIGDGIIKATDYRFYGIQFDFMRFEGVYAMGGMEVLMDLDKYRTTLQTVTDCTILKIPVAKFEKWIKSDVSALQREARLMGGYLLQQGRDSRAYLFLQGSDRLAMLLVRRFEIYGKDGVLRMKGERQGLSDETGLCLKTINRSVKKFSEQGLVTKEGNQIVIEEEQYRKLKEIVDGIIEPDEYLLSK